MARKQARQRNPCCFRFVFVFSFSKGQGGQKVEVSAEGELQVVDNDGLEEENDPDEILADIGGIQVIFVSFLLFKKSLSVLTFFFFSPVTLQLPPGRYRRFALFSFFSFFWCSL